jgi:catechol 2,3-dioxygenase-like lactoylglutathione lyase family enzyme
MNFGAIENVAPEQATRNVTSAMAASHNYAQAWKLVQTGVRASNLDRSVAFYQNVLGLREITRFPSTIATLVFLGFPDGFTPNKMSYRQGVLELMHVNGKIPLGSPTGSPTAIDNLLDSEQPDPNASQDPPSGFIELSFSVPDVSPVAKHYHSGELKIVLALIMTSTEVTLMW